MLYNKIDKKIGKRYDKIKTMSGMDMKFRSMALLAIIILIFSLSYLSSISETGIEMAEEPTTTKTIQSETTDYSNIYGEAAVKVPAVDNEGRGIVTWLTVDIMPGKGRTLTDINQLLFWVDTQYSIQTAKAVAANYTKMNLSRIDIIYAIETDADVVEGPSAGAALTVATVSALINSSPNSDVMITGTIEPDGSIGPVGSVVEKAKAAKDVGATLFLVPEGQSGEVTYVQEKECERLGPITYCTTNYRPVETDVEREVGIEIEEISTVGDALKYFLE